MFLVWRRCENLLSSCRIFSINTLCLCILFVIAVSLIYSFVYFPCSWTASLTPLKCSQYFEIVSIYIVLSLSRRVHLDSGIGIFAVCLMKPLCEMCTCTWYEEENPAFKPLGLRLTSWSVRFETGVFRVSSGVLNFQIYAAIFAPK